MSRQTFATREFFVNTRERTTQQSILNLPQFFSRLQFISENLKLHCITFLYMPEGRHHPVHVVLSLLPLDEGCTKVTVHGSYADGCVFTKDLYMDNVLANVEAALQAAASGSSASFEPIVPKKKFLQRYRKAKHTTAILIGSALKARCHLKPAHS